MSIWFHEIVYFNLLWSNFNQFTLIIGGLDLTTVLIPFLQGNLIHWHLHTPLLTFIMQLYHWHWAILILFIQLLDSLHLRIPKAQNSSGLFSGLTIPGFPCILHWWGREWRQFPQINGRIILGDGTHLRVRSVHYEWMTRWVLHYQCKSLLFIGGVFFMSRPFHKFRHIKIRRFIICQYWALVHTLLLLCVTFYFLAMTLSRVPFIPVWTGFGFLFIFIIMVDHYFRTQYFRSISGYFRFNIDSGLKWQIDLLGNLYNDLWNIRNVVISDKGVHVLIDILLS